MSEIKPFRYYLRVRYGECDQQGVVYNARYGEYVDLTSTEFLRAALAPTDIFDGAFEFQVVKMLIEWTGPARFDDTLEIEVTLKALGTTSYTLGFTMRRAGTGASLVTAETVNVNVDPQSWTKVPLPDAFRAGLTAAARGQAVDHAGYTMAASQEMGRSSVGGDLRSV
jgi:acyl-CoA thioester hydrolase